MTAARVPYLSAEVLADKALMGVAIDALGPAFAALARGALQTPERTLMITGDGRPLRQLLTSPIAWAEAASAAVKITTLTPDNPRCGRALIQGLVVLFDLDSGRPRAMLEGGALTALRTGATAGLAARLLARPDAAVMAVIGAGVQARALVDAMLTVRPIGRVHVASRGAKRLTDFARWIASRWGADTEVRVHDTIDAAVAAADIICTATSTEASTPLVRRGMAPGDAFYAAIGGATEVACELDPGLLEGAAVVVETRSGATAEAGEIRAALANGTLRQEQMIELGSLITGVTLPPDRPIVLRAVGHAVEDLAVADAVIECVSP